MEHMKLVWLFFIVSCCNCYSETFIVFGGKTGWIGKKVVSMLEEQGQTVVIGTSRLENRGALYKELQDVAPDYIINCAGVTGVPNVDWCESHKIETVRTNIIGTLNLIDVAYLCHIPITNFSSGCIYEYDEAHPLGSGVGFTEEEKANFEGSFYSMTKGMFERLVGIYPNLLDLRIRMPLSSEWHPKNLIVKLSRYQKVVNIPNSMTILEDLLPVAIDMTLKGKRGLYNFANPGTISHNQLLDLYKRYIDPSFHYENFSLEEQNKILQSKRSNNELDMSKLLKEYPDLPPIQKSIHKMFARMKETVTK